MVRARSVLGFGPVVVARYVLVCFVGRLVVIDIVTGKQIGRAHV